MAAIMVATDPDDEREVVLRILFRTDGRRNDSVVVRELVKVIRKLELPHMGTQVTTVHLMGLRDLPPAVDDLKPPGKI